MPYITIPGFEAMTPQQVFDTSLAHIRKTRTQAVIRRGEGNGTVCSYVSGSGCAARPFIDDTALRGVVPGVGRDAQSWRRLANEGHVPRVHDDLVAALQAAHDGWLAEIQRNGDMVPNPQPFMAFFEERMAQVARDHGLTYTPETTTQETPAMP